MGEVGALSERTDRGLEAYWRPKPGVGIEQATQEMNLISAQLTRELFSSDRFARAKSPASNQRYSFRPILRLEMLGPDTTDLSPRTCNGSSTARYAGRAYCSWHRIHPTDWD